MKKYFDLPFKLCIEMLELWLIAHFMNPPLFLFLRERPTSFAMELECIFTMSKI